MQIKNKFRFETKVNKFLVKLHIKIHDTSILSAFPILEFVGLNVDKNFLSE